MERIEKNQVALEIEVESDKFGDAVNSAYRKVVKKVNIPGFRKGKVPRRILEQYVGKEALYDEALEHVLPGAYFNALQETDIEPIDKPEIEVVQAEEGKPLIFKAKVQVKPEVDLGEYKGLEVEEPKVEVTEEEITNYLEGLRQRHAKMSEVAEGTVEKGDIAVIDFEGFVDGEAFEGGKADNHSLEIGSNTFIPGFEDQLIGAAIGEERDVNVTFPEEYQAEHLAGKPALFKVKINSIKRKELSDLDDEFAKDVSEFETLEELKQDAQNKLLESAETTANNNFKSQVIEKAAENASVEVPDVMVDQKLDAVLQNMEQRLMQQGLSMEQYFQMTNSSKEQLREDQRSEAEKGTKTDLVLEAISKKEGITASDEDIDNEIKKMAEQYNQEPDSIRNILASQGNLDNMKYSLTMEKTVDFLVENAKKVEKKEEEQAE